MTDYFPNAFRAAATTFSVVNPNFFCKSLIGAEAPKRCMPITMPDGPTYCDQPNVEAMLHRDPRFYLRRQNFALYSSLWCFKKVP